MLNETPKPDLKKIKLAPKIRWQLGALVFALASVLFIVAMATTDKMASGGATPYVLRLEARAYMLEAARTDAEQQKGLADRSSMPTNHGMLFVFSSESKQCFWMKDMRFPLDIIWAASAKRVTHIEHRLSPATYPSQYCAPAQYVIELNAGAAAQNGLHDGQQLNF